MRILINTQAPLQKYFLDALQEIGDILFMHRADDASLELWLKEAQIMICSGGSRADAALINSMPKLELISVYGTGYDGVDVKSCQDRGILVTNTPGVMKDDVADTAVALLLNTVREFPAAYRHLKSGRWLTRAKAITPAFTGMRVGIAGMGAIGREIASRLHNGFRCEIAYFARHNHSLPYTYYSSLKDLASWAQALISVLPGGSSTFHIIDKEVIDALGPDGYLVNVGRGSNVDTVALEQALAANRLSGCGLDVFEREPLLPHGLLRFDNALLLPHVASATYASRDAMADLVLANVRSYLLDKSVKTCVKELER